MNIIERGNKLFSRRTGLEDLWDELYDAFYPERTGTNSGSHLYTSYPVLARRDLGDSFSSMLRPTEKPWFRMTVDDIDRIGVDAKAYLDWVTRMMRKGMYDRASQFHRATKEGDHDFATTGQCVISVEINWSIPALLFRCWPLHSVAWQEDEIGGIGEVHRKWSPDAVTVRRLFPRTVHRDVVDMCKNKPFDTVELRHIVIRSEEYTGSKTFRTPYVSIWMDIKRDHELEAVGAHSLGYIIPRWKTVPGSQYAYSPATVTALADARLIQSMTRVLLDAGESAVTPPLVGTQEAIRGDISVYPGGITWVDSQYDERLGEVLRPLAQDMRGIQFGLEMQQDVREMIAEAFYLNKLTLPAPTNDMTAYEIGQRVQEYIRQALPLFEPMELEYNGALCEEVYGQMNRAGAFGDPRRMPEDLWGMEYNFEFESPLHDAVERSKGQRFIEAKSMLAEAIALDQSSAAIIDAKKALRDTLTAIGVPAAWQRTEQEVAAIEAQIAERESAEQMLSQMKQGAEVARDLRDATTPAGTV